MSTQEAAIPEAHAKFIHSWFDGLTSTRDDPKSKYPPNIRYQNVCAKIELVQEELTSYERKSPTSEQNGKIPKTGTCLNTCERLGERENKMVSSDRNTLIAHIQRILPEIRQHFV